MISRINSAVLNGLDVVATEVEVGFSRGIPGIVIVGLPDNAVKESRERLKLAVTSSQFRLSPGDQDRDQPLAGRCAQGRIGPGPAHGRRHHQEPLPPGEPGLRELLFYGELNLNGDLNPVKGVLNISLFAREKGWRGIVIPYENRLEAQFVPGHRGLCPEEPHRGHRVDRTSRGLRPLPFRPGPARPPRPGKTIFPRSRGNTWPRGSWRSPPPAFTMS